MIKIKVVNWRCIENLELELAKINIFIGKNSTGKSSLAYAIYFASKSRNYDPQYLLFQMYGCSFNEVARLVDNKPQFPISIKIENSELSIDKKEEKFEINILQNSPWSDEFLLPSKRNAYYQIMMLLRRITGELKNKPEATFIMSFVGGLFELFKGIPISPPFGIFAIDYTRAVTGFQIKPIVGGLKYIGNYLINVIPLFSLIEFTYQDPFVNLQLPPELTPDGLLDFSICDSVVKGIPEGSLVIIEEPEIHKNPLMIKEYTEEIIKKSLDKKITLILVTHSDIPLITIGDLIVKKILKPEEVKVYYFKRDPWTKISEIKVYEDGTIESLPDSEELITHLF